MKRRRRERSRERPFPSEWTQILERRVPLYRRLDAADRDELQRHIQVFLDEKRFEGCDGFEVTDDVRLVVAAHACLLLLHRETDYYPTLQTILVYPTTFMVEFDEHDAGGIVSPVEEDRAGESWNLGPVVLSWDDVLDGTAGDADGYNVVIHEFAHQLDLENGEVDGAPRLGGREAYAKWADVFTRAYDRFTADVDRGRRTAIDEYGAEGPPEFFAVVTEAFFEMPDVLKRAFPDVYDELARFFAQDPLSWPGAARSSERRRRRRRRRP